MSERDILLRKVDELKAYQSTLPEKSQRRVVRPIQALLAKVKRMDMDELFVRRNSPRKNILVEMQ